MGCNCKATEQIIKIHKNYGHEINNPWHEKLGFKLWEGIKLIFIALLFVVFFPVIFIFGIAMIISGKGIINVNKLLNFFLRKNG